MKDPKRYSMQKRSGRKKKTLNEKVSAFKLINNFQLKISKITVNLICIVIYSKKFISSSLTEEHLVSIIHNVHTSYIIKNSEM